MSAPNEIKKGRGLRTLHRIGSTTGRSKATLHFTAWLFATAALLLIFAMSQFATARNRAAAQTIVADTAPQCVSPPAGTTHWWILDGDATDFEGAANNGALVNGPVFVPGKVAQALSLNASQHQYVDVGTINLGVTFSVDAWINPIDLTSSPVIIGNYDGTNGFFVDVFSGGQLRGFTGAGPTTQTFYATAPVITTGAWQHIAVTYDGNAGAGAKFHFYVNGTAVAANVTADAGGAPGASSVSAKIGANPASGDLNNFDGLIDELDLLNVTLSRTEVAGIYKADGSGKCKPTVAVPYTTPIPNGNGNFAALHAPSFNGSAITFGGQGSGQAGMYFEDIVAGSLIKIADLNTPVPNGTGNFLSFLPGGPSLSGDNVVSYGAGPAEQGIYLFNRRNLGNPCRIADTNTAIPGGTGNFTGFFPLSSLIGPNPSVDGNNVAFGGQGSGQQQGMYLETSNTCGSPSKIADRNTVLILPGGHTGFISGFPTNPSISGNAMAFVAESGASYQGIFLVNNFSAPSLTKIADTGTPIPGGSGNFSSFSTQDPSLSGNRLAFVANGQSGQKQVGEWDFGRPLKKVADLNTAIPDGTGNFTSFGAVSVSATDLALIGNGSNGAGIFDLTAGDELQKVIATGQVIGGKTITGLTMGRTGLNGDPIAFQATFDDGSQAIYIIEVHALPTHRLANISTRGVTMTGNNVLIGGIIISGGGPKQVVLRALGPTLGKPPFNVPGALQDPVLELHDSAGALITSNDNWGSAANAAAITASGFAPPDAKESAILASLDPGNYTAIVRGANNTTGITLFEAYDLDTTVTSKFGNISTRGFVETGAGAMIVGVIVDGPNSQDVIARGLGPTLGQPPFNVPNSLPDPFLDLRDANGNRVMANDNWQDTQQAEIQASGLAPPNNLESAIAITLAPGDYTAILSGKNNSTGNALVEVYGLN
jgi:hypothetical protein